MKRLLLFIMVPLLFLTTCTEPVVDTFGNIAGTVTDSQTLAPLAGVSVKISPTGSSQVTGNNGSFQFDNLEVQEYTISFSKKGYHSHEEKVSVKPGLSSTIQVSMVPMSSIVGTVKDSKTQSVLAGVTVKISPGNNSVMTGDDGSFHFDNLDPREYTLSFSKTGYNSHEEKVTVKSGVSSTVQITLVSKSSIVGAVKDSKTQGMLSGVTVKISPGNNSVMTGDDGSFHFDNLDPQEYTLSFSKTGYNSHEEKVTVKSGVSSTVQVALVPKSSIVGTVKDSNTQNLLPGVTVKLSPGGSSVITGNDGSFGFNELSAQEYTLSFSKNGYNSKDEKVTIKDGETKTVDVLLSEISVSLPTLYMNNPSNVTKTSVRLHATLSSTGGSQVTQHGFCYGTNHNPTTNDKTSSLGIASGTCSFTADLSGLTAGTVYYVRAYAQNSAGIAYSDEIFFTTLSDSEGGDNGGGTNSIAVPAGLKLYYTFDGGDCSDATDKGNDGISVNNPTYTTDTPNGSGKAIVIDGDKEQYININFNAFKGLSSYSVAFWINDFSTGAIFSGINPSQGEYASRQDAHWPKLFMRNDGKIGFDACGSYYDYHDFSSKFSYNYTSIQSSGWHHIAVSYDGSIAYLYVDGNLKDNVNTDYNNPTNITKINIGGNGNNTFPVYPSMKLDNFRIYSRCLTKDDVKQIYEAEK